jgi:mono/diheme cytochrome c family protein
MTVRASVVAACLGALALGALALAACAHRPGRGDVVWGHQIALANCAKCHGIEADSPRSPNPFAPVFHSLRKHYAALTLNTTFTPTTLRGHAPMPSFALRIDDMADLLAYVQSIQEPGSPAWPKPPFAQCGVGANC